MPLYEYECQDCGRHFEVIQKFSDDLLTECSECEGALEKVLSAPAVHFKGSGWYVTDYGRKGAEKGDGEKGEASKDAKPEKAEKSDSAGDKSEKKSSPKDKDSSK